MGIGIFRQLDGGRLEPIATRRTEEEAQSLIGSLEKLWSGVYVFRELRCPSITPSEAFDLLV